MVRGAKLAYERVLEDELMKAGWAKGWRKTNNMIYWIKAFPKEGIVTATSLEDALMWEYEL